MRPRAAYRRRGRARAVPRAVRRGLSFARTNPSCGTLLIGRGVALVLFTLVIPIEVIYAKESLGTTSAGFGILLASWGAGIVVGSLIYLLIRRQSTLLLILVSTAAIGVAYLGMAKADTLLVACLVSIVGGAGNGIQWISVVTALQEHTPTTTRRGSSGCSSRSARPCRAWATCSGARSSRSGSPRTAYAVAGAGVLVLVCAGFLMRRIDGSVSSRSGRMRAPTGTAQVKCHCRTPSLQRPPSRRARPLRAATIVRTA